MARSATEQIDPLARRDMRPALPERPPFEAPSAVDGDVPVGVGAELGRGMRTVVYRYGPREAVKVAAAGTPDAWLRAECRHLESAERAGAPCPRGAALVWIGARLGLSTERIDGPNMSDILRADPSSARAMGRVLAELQLAVFRCRPSLALPAQADRLRAKLWLAGRANGLQVDALVRWISGGGPLGLCHGDLHTRNVILSADGPVLVDWFDAGRGNLPAEIARTSVVIASGAGQPDTAATMGELHEAYLACVLTATGMTAGDIERWRTVQMVAQLAEGVGGHPLGEIRRRLAGW